MTTLPGAVASTTADRTGTRTDYPPSSLLFDYAAAGGAIWFLIGLFLDGWAHNHGRVDNTFFTPWHLVLYSGYGAVGLLMVGTQFRNVARGYAFTRSLPRGYWLALVGVMIFGVAGALDFGWHSVFGFEENLEALLSPSHLALATGGFLFGSGPIRAAWHRRQQTSSWREMLPLIAALLGIMSLLTFFTQYASVGGNLIQLTGRRPGDDYVDVVGIVSIVMYTTILLGMTLVVARRWRLPMGAFALMHGVNMLLMTWVTVRNPLQYFLVIPALAVGLLVDMLLRRWHPLHERITHLRIFSFIMPFALSLAYLAGLSILGYSIFQRGLWWKVHMWLGVPFTAGIAGYLMSFVMVPPAISQDEEI
jgi:hypothetical protein